MLRSSFATKTVLILAAVAMAPAGFAQFGPGGGGPGGGGEGGHGGGRSGGQHREGGREHDEKQPTADVPAQTPEQLAALKKLESVGVPLDRVVAIVNDGIVTESELDEQLLNIKQQLTQRGVNLPPEDVLRSQVLDRLVLQQVQLQRADQLGLKITDEQLNATIADIAKSNKMTLSQLPDALAAQGVDYASFRDNTRKEMTLASLRQREVLSKINITPRELDQFMERLKKTPGEKDEYNISHILITTPQDATQAQVDEASKKAQDIATRAATEDFSKLAVTYSKGQTALEGGALGWVAGPNLPTWSAAAIATMKPGDVSKPISTPLGFQIVKLNSVRNGDADEAIQDQVHVRHILIKPNALQDDATVRLKLAGIRQKVLDGQDFAAFASSMSEDTGSSVNGGDLDWMSPDGFDPEFAQAIAGLKDGEITQPFHTQFGWHIAQMLGRRKFDTTEENLRDRAFRQLRDSKADEETELWLRQLRDQAYIDTKL